MSVHQEQKVFIGDQLRRVRRFRRRLSQKGKGRDFWHVSWFHSSIGHLVAIWTEPENVFDSGSLDGTALEEIPATKDRMVFVAA